MPPESDTFPSSDGSSSSARTELEEPHLPYAGFTWMEAGMIVGACVLITALLLVANLTQSCCGPSTQAEMLRQTTGRLSYFFLWALSTLPIFWGCVRLRPRTKGWGPVLAGHAGLALTIPFVVQWAQNGILTGVFFLWPSSDPPSFALDPIVVLRDLDFLTELIPYLVLLAIGLVREGYLRGQARRKQAEALEREAEQLRSQLTEARLESLRMQINPHFFHNTLHTISTMAGRDPEGIRRATARLSDLMRYVLSTSDQQEVTLDEEVDVLESYLDIQKLRLDDRLDVTFDIDPAARTALVPTLLLQPLAENAVKHGFEGADETGHLIVRAVREDDTLVLEVADDGAGLPENGESSVDGGRVSNPTDVDEGVGLSNIAERLEGLYGDAASLDFERAQSDGLRVVIRLPFHTPESDDTLRASGVVAG